MSDGAYPPSTCYKYLCISTDSGVTWTRQTSAGQRSWSGLASSSDGTKLAAAVSGGYIYTSTDSGATWTERTGAGSRTWQFLASSSDGAKLATGVYGGYLYTSTDSGATWTQQTSAGSRNWYSATSSSDGTKLAVTVINGYIYTSNSFPVASSVSVTGTLNINQLLTGNYTYTDADSDAEGTSTFRWLRDDVAIGGATSLTYTTVLADVTKTIKFEVTPVALTGTSPGNIATSDGIVIVVIVPVLTASSATFVERNSVTLNGEITATGGENAETKGFNYGLTTSYGTNTTDTGSYDVGVFTSNISSLSCSTAYHFRSYATNSAGSGYSADNTFTTNNCPSFGSTLAYRTNYVAQQQAIASSTTSTPNQTITNEVQKITKNLKFGIKNNDVKTVQTYLNKTFNLSLALDGRFGPKTKSAVIQFQKANELKADGIVGPLTKAKMK